MAINMETTSNSAALATLLSGGYLTADVTITSPAHNAILGTSFTITGTASCTAHPNHWERIPPMRRAASRAVTIRLGGKDDSFQLATPTGSGSRPWATWSFTVNNAPQGLLTITAWVNAGHSELGGASDTSSGQDLVDITPPTLTVNPPAPVTRPAPPYTATITGTASDRDLRGSGVALVEWRLGSSGAFQAASGTYRV